MAAHAIGAPTAIAAPTPVHAAAPADNAPADGASFAALLDRSREARQAAPDQARDKPADDSDEPTDGPQSPTAGRAARRADRAPAPHRAERAAPGEAATEESGATPQVDKAQADDTAAPADTPQPPWLAALQTPPTLPAHAAASGDPADAGVSATAALQTTAAPAPQAPASRPEAARDATVDESARQVQPALRDEAGLTGDPTAPVATAAERTASPQPDLAQPLAAPAPLAAPQRAAEAAPVAAPAATLDPPVDSPEFAAALGVQVSVFARDGLHQAELQLNPTEMGPVSVQIALDGTQARVHFGAEVAATRQAIEASLPELAAALREAGFTLSGGGVSQQRSGRGNESEGGADGSPRRSRGVAGGAGENGVTPRVAQRRVALGGVDLYA